MKQINLMSLHSQGDHKKIEFVLLFCGVLFFSFLLIGLMNISISYQIQKLNSHKSQLFNQLSMVSLSIEKLQKIKKQADQLHAAKQALSINRKQIRKIVSLLEDIQVLAPPDFFIQTISYKMPYIVIAGATKTEKTFLALIKKLEKKYHLNFKCKYKKNKNLLFEFIVNMPLVSENKNISNSRRAVSPITPQRKAKLFR